MAIQSSRDGILELASYDPIFGYVIAHAVYRVIQNQPALIIGAVFIQPSILAISTEELLEHIQKYHEVLPRRP